MLSRSTAAPRLRWLLVVGLLVANICFLALGALAAIAGGSYADLGSGAGGLGGWANELMSYFAILVGLIAAVATVREGRSVLVGVAVFATGILVATGFLEVGHLLDPCARGWWGRTTTIGGAPLCSAQGEIALRFHLLLHGGSGVLAAGVAVAIHRRAGLFEWWPPEGRPAAST